MFRKLVLIIFCGILQCILANVSQGKSNTTDIEIHSVVKRTIQSSTPYCKILGICKIVDSLKNLINAILSFSFINPHEYNETMEIQERSYYSGYATPTNTLPTTYYPAFDPISVLASLAFLAFLLQSLAPLFDRSRSIISEAIRARRSSEYDIVDTTNPILRALEKYESHYGHLISGIHSDEIYVNKSIARKK